MKIIGSKVLFNDLRFNPPKIKSGIMYEVTLWFADKPDSYKVLSENELVDIEDTQIVR